MKKLLKLLLLVLILAMSISLVTVFSLVGGCKPAVSTVEEVTDELEEETVVEEEEKIVVEEEEEIVEETTKPWQEWTPTEKGTFLKSYFHSLKNGDEAKLAEMVSAQLDNMSFIVKDMLGLSDVARKVGEIGWDMETYTAEEFMQAAESMAALYAKQTGDLTLQEQVIDRKQ